MNEYSATTLRAAGLAAYAYTQLAEEHPLKSELRQDYVNSLARHHQIKSELVPLIAAWRQHGIEVMLYKGFFLSEFVYPVPGARRHGDVDILVRHADGDRARDIGVSLGWSEGPNADDQGREWFHEAFTLYRRGGATRIDAHRWFTRRSVAWHPRPLKIADAVWEAARTVDWSGTVVRIPTLVDQFLAGIVLDRCIGDGWLGFKPQDGDDMAHLSGRGVTLEDIRHRAADLGISRSLELALSCYDRESGQFTASPWYGVPWRMLTGFRETGSVRFPEWMRRIPRAPRAARDVLRVLPVLLRVRRALSRRRDIREILASLTPGLPDRQTSRKRRNATVRGIKWAVKLLRLGPEAGDCLPRSLAVYSALRAEGWPVVFVSGVRRDGERIAGHAWVELNGSILPELIGRENMPDYVPAFRYPE